MTVNEQSVKIAQHYFKHTNRRATPATMRQAIGQAKTLLNSGYGYDEITLGIEYCVKHPPKGGFRSLGWLSYDLENIMIKIKAQETKKALDGETAQQSFFGVTPIETIRKIDEKKSEDRVSKDYDFNIFGKED